MEFSGTVSMLCSGSSWQRKTPVSALESEAKRQSVLLEAYLFPRRPGLGYARVQRRRTPIVVSLKIAFLGCMKCFMAAKSREREEAEERDREGFGSEMERRQNNEREGEM
ncbi:hypothetical protein L484_012686 [Morus notabilis]|uniref:Uncharacterized protein n=1 Tax=Morus notabilis TaxID=981085 RepID=W9QMP8_9ROSA|nr:hypothetical protein L484_012686 [Morus notabilis]